MLTSMNPTTFRYAGDIYASEAHLHDLYTRAGQALRHSPRGSFISHHTAAALRGLWAPSSAQIHVTTPPRADRVTCEGVQSHRGHKDAWVAQLADLPASAPEQVVLELSRSLDLVDLVALIDSVLARGLSDKDGIRGYLRFRNDRGRKLADAIDLARTGSGSAMETRSRLLLVHGGFPEPRLQVPVLVRPEMLTARELSELSRILGRSTFMASRQGITFKLDMAYRRLKYAIEYDGEHHLTDEQKAYDTIRRDVLPRLGWTIETCTVRDITSHPEAFLERAAVAYNALSAEPVELDLGDGTSSTGDVRTSRRVGESGRDGADCSASLPGGGPAGHSPHSHSRSSRSPAGHENSPSPAQGIAHQGDTRVLQDPTGWVTSSLHPTGRGSPSGCRRGSSAANAPRRRRRGRRRCPEPQPEPPTRW